MNDQDSPHDQIAGSAQEPELNHPHENDDDIPQEGRSMTDTQIQNTAPISTTAPTTAVDEQFKLFVDVETLGLPRPGASTPGMRLIGHEYPVLSASFILWSLHRGVLWDSGEVLFDDLRAHRYELHVDPVAHQMHRANGLLQRVESAGPARGEPVEATVVFSAAQDRVLVAIDELAGPEAKVLLAGKSPGALDAPVLAIHMPALAGRLSHRIHDVSTLERDAKLVGIDLEELVKASGHVYDHTASADNRFAVAMYEAYLVTVLGLDLGR